MALQLAYEAPTGDIYLEAYRRITHVNINAAAQGVEIIIAIYRDAAARGSNKTPVHISTMGVVLDDYRMWFSTSALDAINPVRQAYEYCKSQKTFAEATDV